MSDTYRCVCTCVYVFWSYGFNVSAYTHTHTHTQELKEENKHICQEKEDLEAEILSNTTATTESELTSVKRMKRDLETKVEELEDELDEANIKYVVLATFTNYL